MEGGAAAGRDVVVVDYAVEGEVYVVGREGLPVVPAHVRTEVECPGQAVVRTLPGLGQHRLHLVGQPGGLGQALEEIAQDTRRRSVVRDGEVESKRLGDRGEGQSAAPFPDGVLETLGVLPS